LWLDNGTEFINLEFSKFLKDNDVVHELTCVNTVQQNGVVERINRHLLEVTRALFFQMSVPNGESYLEVKHVIKSLPFLTQDVQVQVQEVTKLTLVPEQVQMFESDVSIPDNSIEEQVQLFEPEVSILDNFIEDVTDEMPIALRKGKRSCVKYLISQFVCTDHLSMQHQSFIVVIDAIKTPTSVQEALKDLEEEVYMEIPLGFYSHNEKNKVCRLKKALYGLKQSPRAWFGRFSQVMISQDTGRVKHDPRERHLQAVERILHYLKASPGKGLLFKKEGTLSMEIYTDVDYAGSVVDRRSTSGYCMFLGGNLVTWKSKKQNVVARSSAEAEFRAMAHGICEGLWMKIILDDFKVLFCDNNPTMNIAHNLVQHDRTKHIEIDRHFIKEKLDSGLIVTSHVHT
ncbi:Copia protein, partial [Mucuna pruriens]